ncbi:Ima1 N-terminal domain-containing protein [Aspergillus venezuelensis]
MAPLFSKRLSCFYCGRRSAQLNKGSVRKWQCKHCEAINYLDENGDITDPPAAETNPNPPTPGPAKSLLEPSDLGLTGSDLFCAQCVRNQHLFTNALASYFPSSDDPNYSAYEREYPKFRRNLEERYPQVCDRCEPRVKARIRQAGYEAKSDHLRRMMDRSKAGKAARKARQWNWRSLLVFAGAMCYWASIVGQLAWSMTSALPVEEPLRDPEDLTSPSIASRFNDTLRALNLPSHCPVDLVPYAGLSLVAGILSIWWNPKLRLKVEGRGGRFVRLGEYYQVQLIVLVVRCAFWAVLRDPSSHGLDATLPPALHTFMVLFTILSVVISRRIVRYDTRPLVNWSEDTPTATPVRNTEMSPRVTTGPKQPFYIPHENSKQMTPRFPVEKLATPRTAQEERHVPTPPPEVDDMDWTPSIQHNFRPASTAHQRDQRKAALSGPTPFYGSLPAAPKPPSWKLRTQHLQRQKPIDEVVQPNPFHRTPAQSSLDWGRAEPSPDPVFAPPKFFPLTDHASTGLENLFDRAFTIKSAENDEPAYQSPRQARPRTRSPQSVSLEGAFVSQCVRLGLLLISLTAWSASQYGLVSVRGYYIEVASLGCVSLLAGFALLESVKQPLAHWNGMELLVYIAELTAAVHLGGYLPGLTTERHYFDRYGKLLLIFMIVQETLALLAFYRETPNPNHSSELVHEQHRPSSPSDTIPTDSPRSGRSRRSTYQPLGTPSSTAPPPLSFTSTANGSSFNTHHSEPASASSHSRYHLPYSHFDSPFSTSSSTALSKPTLNSNSTTNNHSFSLKSLKSFEADSDHDSNYDRDSDTETTMTTATGTTNNTVKDIRYGRNSTVNDTFFSPRRSELGPGLGSLSLDDGPSLSTGTQRMTRSQSQRLQAMESAAGARRRVR